MIVTFVSSLIQPRSATPKQTYDLAKSWIARLGHAHPDFVRWWANPRGPKDNFVDFTDEAAMLGRLAEEEQQRQAEFPAVPSAGKASLLLTNAGNEKDWKSKGRASLSIRPSSGKVRLSISGPEKIYPIPHDICWRLLKALAPEGEVRSVQADIQQKVGGEMLIYSIHRAPFPHREFLGWMGYVPQALTTEQVPNAAKLERQGSGTLILSTPLLDLADPAAIKQANQVEMSLVDLDLLPVIDPDLM